MFSIRNVILKSWDKITSVECESHSLWTTNRPW